MSFTHWRPTTDQILNLDGVTRRADSFRFELCNRSWRPIGGLHPDRAVTTPSVSAAATSARRLSGLMLPESQAADVDVLTDRLRVYMVLQNSDEFLLGSFMWGAESEPLRSWGPEHHSELTDPTFILDQEVTRPYGWSRGGNIHVIMHFLLRQAGFEPRDFFIAAGADRGLSEPMSWQPGTTWMRMLEDLCAIVGFAKPWADRFGVIFLRPAPDEDSPTTVPAYEPGTRIIADSITFTRDMLDAPNDFAVFHSGTDRIITGRAQIPASAPHSFARRGFRIGKAESQQGIETQGQANVAARNLRRSEGLAHQWLAFESSLDPRHDLWDVYDALGSRWVEESWDMQLRSGGKMGHRARRTIYAPA
jgi:hypothetical protein